MRTFCLVASCALLAVAIIWRANVATEGTAARRPTALEDSRSLLEGGSHGMSPRLEAGRRPALRRSASPAATRAEPVPTARPAAGEQAEESWEGVTSASVLVEKPDGTPAPGARVRAWLQLGVVDRPLDTVWADADGRCEVSLSPTQALAPLDRAHAWRRVEAGVAGFGPSSELLKPRQVTVLRLALGSSLHGRVLSEAGQPVPGAEVVASPASGAGVIRITTTGESGDYELYLPKGDWALLRVDVGGLGGARLRIDPLAAGQDMAVPDLVLRTFRRIEGVARYEDGRPAAGMRVTAVYDPAVRHDRAAAKPDSEGFLHSETRTGPDGAFRLAGLAPGRFRLWSEGTGVWQWHETGERDVALRVTARRVRLRVLDDEGRPLDGASTTMSRMDDRRWYCTGDWFPSGREAWYLPGERVHLSAVLPDASPAMAEIVVPTDTEGTEVTLTLRPDFKARGTIRLRVRAEDGTPCQSAGVQPLSALTEPSLEDRWGPEDLHQGEVVLPPLAPGPYDFEITPYLSREGEAADTYVPIHARAVVEKDREFLLDIRARRGGRIRLTVHLEGGADPPPHVELQVRLSRADAVDAPLDVSWETRLGVDTFTWGAVPERPGVSDKVLEAGPYRLRVTASGYRPTEGMVVVRAGHVEDAELSLDRE